VLNTMKFRSAFKWFIPTVIFLVFVVFVFKDLYDQSAIHVVEPDNPVRIPKATLNLKDVILVQWDKDVSEISKIFPGGKLIQWQFDEREMNVYWIDTMLSDVDSKAKISFQRNENNSGQLVTHRTVQLKVSSTGEVENKYEQIISTLPSYGMKIMNLGKSDFMDPTFHRNSSISCGFSPPPQPSPIKGEGVFSMMSVT